MVLVRGGLGHITRISLGRPRICFNDQEIAREKRKGKGGVIYDKKR